MSKSEWFKRESGVVLSIIVSIFVALSFYVFKLSFDLIIMGVKGEFEILAEWKGLTLYLFSVSPGILLAGIMALIWIFGVPKILHPSNFGKKKK